LELEGAYQVADNTEFDDEGGSNPDRAIKLMIPLCELLLL
jgi:hypothetical protein